MEKEVEISSGLCYRNRPRNDRTTDRCISTCTCIDQYWSRISGRLSRGCCSCKLKTKAFKRGLLTYSGPYFVTFAKSGFRISPEPVQTFIALPAAGVSQASQTFSGSVVTPGMNSMDLWIISLFLVIHANFLTSCHFWRLHFLNNRKVCRSLPISEGFRNTRRSIVRTLSPHTWSRCDQISLRIPLDLVNLTPKDNSCTQIHSLRWNIYRSLISRWSKWGWNCSKTLPKDNGTAYNRPEFLELKSWDFETWIQI